MRSGRQTLGSIDQAIQKLTREESQLDASLRSATEEAGRLRAERTAALKELARIKLDEIKAGRLVANLDAAERRAVGLIEDMRLRIESVASRRDALADEVARAEVDRSTAAARVEEALEAVEALRLDAEAKARETPGWAAAKEEADAAERVAVEAERKATQAEAELALKKKPYDDDPLFTYLWQQGYGTRAYAAGPLVRHVDGIVARFVGYTDARANFAMLGEIPVRLREHAARRRTLADDRRAAVERIEREAMVAAGVDRQEKALAEARHRLAAADDLLERKRRLLGDIEAERDRLLATGQDAVYADALETIAGADAKDDVATLLAEARRTATPADETIVRRIAAIDESIARADREIAEIRKTARDLAARRAEVEGVRERFRGAGYDHPSATFGNGVELDDVLEGIVKGVVRSGVLWDLVRAGFGIKPPKGRRDFGYPSFPFPFPIPGGGREGPRGGDWRAPQSQGGWFPPLDLPGGSGSKRRGRDRDDDDDDDDDDDRRGFRTGGRF